MRFASIAFPVIAVLLATTGAAQAADRYVSGTGLDSNNGNTEQTAYRTLNKAATVVNPGDTVWILDGTYSSTQWVGVSFTRSGTENAWITWKAKPGHHPELVLTANNWVAINVDASYQVIDGLTITGMMDAFTLDEANADMNATSASPRFNEGGIQIDNRFKATRDHHLVIRNCTIRKCTGGGISILGGDDVLIEDNAIYENCWYGRYAGSGISCLLSGNTGTDTGYRIIVQRNRVWRNECRVIWKDKGFLSDGNGIIMDTLRGDTLTKKDSQGNITATDVYTPYTGRALVANNVSWMNGGSGMHAYKSDNVDFINNTAWNNGQMVGYPEIGLNNANNSRVTNNIMYARSGGNTTWGTGSLVGNVFNHNIQFGPHPSSGANDLFVDPKFRFLDPLNPAACDFRLLDTSPAIDAGTVISGMTPVVDVTGLARPQRSGIDRGAYELPVNLAPVITQPAMSGTSTIVLP